MTLFETALEFATTAHSGQLDKSGLPHIMHVLAVWNGVRNRSITTQIVALLHDTVEDTSVTIDEIRTVFGEEIASAVALLTKNPVLKYEIGIMTIAQSRNIHAVLVKLSDLEHNSSPERLRNLSERDTEYFKKRVEEKYLPAKKLLLSVLGGLDVAS